MSKKNKKVLEIINTCIENKIVSGISYCYISKETTKKYYFGTQGFIPPFNDIALDYTMLYDLASITKVIGTTTRIMQLINEKKLSLDTIVADIITDLKFKNITVKELLLHNSGLMPDFKNKIGLSKTNIISKINSTTLDIKKNTAYSDLGFILLGIIIEKIDQTNLEESFKQHIFNVINMKHTSYKKHYSTNKYVPTEIQENVDVFKEM